MGDLFDFWFEYQYAVPKGFVRLIGTMAELSDAGVKLQVFTGNHDLWMRDYFKDEMNIDIHYSSSIQVFNDKKFFLAHGDGLGPGDYSYKRMKKVFTHPFSKFLYRWLHPDIGIPLANYFSGKSRMAQLNIKEYLGREKEWLIQYAEKKSQEVDADYFIFGHRHIPIDYTLKNNRSRYINLGDWLYHQSYAVLENQNLELKFYQNEKGLVFH
jgi:UDP-2,3-diacylglucosamine hydrolase